MSRGTAQKKDWRIKNVLVGRQEIIKIKKKL